MKRTSLTQAKETTDAEITAKKLPSLSELPYDIAKVTGWNSYTKYHQEMNVVFTESNVSKKDSINTFDILTAYYYLPKDNIYGFGTPTEDDFPVGSKIKIYYNQKSTNESSFPIALEMLEY